MNKDFKDLDDVLNSKEFQQKLEKEKSKKTEKKKMTLDDIFDLIQKNYEKNI
tara:strand:+ start:764 stop:919 length:156 start_codon:yes stop_codon:yes gene_type:complete